MKRINSTQLLQLVGALIGAVFLYYGISADDLTTWGAIGQLAKDAISNPAVIIGAIGAVVACLAKLRRKGDDTNAN